MKRARSGEELPSTDKANSPKPKRKRQYITKRMRAQQIAAAQGPASEHAAPAPKTFAQSNTAYVLHDAASHGLASELAASAGHGQLEVEDAGVSSTSNANVDGSQDASRREHSPVSTLEQMGHLVTAIREASGMSPTPAEMGSLLAAVDGVEENIVEKLAVKNPKGLALKHAAPAGNRQVKVEDAGEGGQQAGQQLDNPGQSTRPVQHAGQPQEVPGQNMGRGPPAGQQQDVPGHGTRPVQQAGQRLEYPGQNTHPMQQASQQRAVPLQSTQPVQNAHGQGRGNFGLGRNMGLGEQAGQRQAAPGQARGNFGQNMHLGQQGQAQQAFGQHRAQDPRNQPQRPTLPFHPHVVEPLPIIVQRGQFPYIQTQNYAWAPAHGFQFQQGQPMAIVDPREHHDAVPVGTYIVRLNFAGGTFSVRVWRATVGGWVPISWGPFDEQLVLLPLRVVM